MDGCKNDHIRGAHQLPPNYIWCPVCGVKCFEKNLNRHNATARCIENGIRRQDMIEFGIHRCKNVPIGIKKKNITTKSLLKRTLEENERLNRIINEHNLDIIYTEKIFTKLIKFVIKYANEIDLDEIESMEIPQRMDESFKDTSVNEDMDNCDVVERSDSVIRIDF